LDIGFDQRASAKTPDALFKFAIWRKSMFDLVKKGCPAGAIEEANTKF